MGKEWVSVVPDGKRGPEYEESLGEPTFTNKGIEYRAVGCGHGCAVGGDWGNGKI